MATLLATYAVACVAVSGYITWLVVGHRRLTIRQRRLKTELTDAHHEPSTTANAA